MFLLMKALGIFIYPSLKIEKTLALNNNFFYYIFFFDSNQGAYSITNHSDQV